MEFYKHLNQIVNCAVAADGGSIYLCLADEGGKQKELVLNRAISARGTPEFNRVFDEESGLLSDQRQACLREQLIKLASQMGRGDSGCFELLTRFIDYTTAVPG